MTPRRGAEPERLYLGWQYATPHADPGPPPSPPVSAGRQPVPHPAGDGWLAAQRREENLITRPLKAAATTAAVIACVLAACAAAGWVPAVIAALVAVLCLVTAGRCGYQIWRGERVLRARASAELLRAERLHADEERRLTEERASHARRTREWQAQRSAFTSQKRWYAVPVPEGIDRVDVAGGTLAGWSAALTMSAAYRLATGGEVTVVDLSGGAVAADLAGLCAAADGAPPAIWVLPHDLPRLDLVSSLPPGSLADVLALSVSAAGRQEGSARDLAVDTAILQRVIEALDGPGPVQVARVAAALRALAQVGDPRTDLAAGLLTEREAGALGTLFGQGATDRVVLERALGMEAQLRTLAGAGTEPARLPRGRLRVIAVDRRASPQSAAILGSFVVTALAQLIARAPAGPGPASWRHPLFLLGAERLRDDVLDLFTDACEASRSGLVLGYRSLPPHVRQRIGRGNAVTAFMRLGNAEDAKAASEQVGTAYRFVLSQLTETVGESVTDTFGGSYTSTVGDSASIATSDSSNESGSAGTGRTIPVGGGVLPLRDGGSRSAQTGTSWGTTQSVSLTEGISTSTAWGVSTSRAAGDSESLARSLQRSRELVVEPSELQRLPVTAMIVSYGAGAERRVLLADANPAIGALPVATLAPLAGLSRAATDFTGRADITAPTAPGRAPGQADPGPWPDPMPWPARKPQSLRARHAAAAVRRSPGGGERIASAHNG